MNVRKLVHKLTRLRPKSYDDFEERVGIELIYLDSGCFREAYNIGNTRLVIKFPKGRAGISHARREMRRAMQIMRRETLRHLRRYIPKIYYQNYKTGVLIMEMLNRVGKVPEKPGNIVETMFRDTFKITTGTDMGYTNLGYNGRDQIKALDLGCV